MPTSINCHDIVDFTFGFGELFIIAALAAAAAMAVVEAFAKYREAIAKARADRAAGEERTSLTGAEIGPLLGALKDLLIALGNLPAWFAIFLAGGALIWFARDTLSACP